MAEEVEEATATEESGTPEATPPWGSAEEFNPEKAWDLIQNVRSDKDTLKSENEALAAQVKAFEDEKLSDQEKAERDRQEQATASATLASENAILKAVIKHGLTDEDVELLQGIPAEQIAQRAEKLAARLGTGAPKQNPLQRTPKEALRGGSDPSTPAQSGDWLRAMLANKDQL